MNTEINLTHIQVVLYLPVLGGDIVNIECLLIGLETALKQQSEYRLSCFFSCHKYYRFFRTAKASFPARKAVFRSLICLYRV